MTRWALEDAANPTLLRLHVDAALTDATILTCPPGAAPEPIDRLLEIEAIRSIDLHRYRARLNLRADADRATALRDVSEVLEHAFGPALALTPDPGPRAFETEVTGGRRVAESPAMAAGHPLLAAVFAVEGVSEAVAGEGVVLVRLGRLFAWSDREDAVQASLGGIPGSTSSSR